jgi:hypothetical protein
MPRRSAGGRGTGSQHPRRASVQPSLALRYSPARSGVLRTVKAGPWRGPRAPDSPAFASLHIVPLRSRQRPTPLAACFTSLCCAARNRRDRRKGKLPPLASASPVLASATAQACASRLRRPPLRTGHAPAPDIGPSSGRPCSALGLWLAPSPSEPRPGAPHSRPEEGEARPPRPP